MYYGLATRKCLAHPLLIAGIGNAPVKIEARQPCERSNAPRDGPHVGEATEMEHLDDAAADKAAGAEKRDAVAHRATTPAILPPLSSLPRAISRSSSQGIAMSERWR